MKHELTSTHIVGVFASQATYESPASWLVDWVRNTPNDAGVSVTPGTSLGLPAIYFCVNRIANDIGQLPLPTYIRSESKAREIAYRMPSYQVLEVAPNDLMTPAVFRKTIQAHALMYGNGRAWIVRNGRGEPMELIPLPPDRTKTVMVYDNDDEISGEKWHVVFDAKGRASLSVPDTDALHVMSLSNNGIWGLGLVDFAKNAVGEGLASQKFVNRNFKNQGVPPMVLEAPPGAFRTEAEASEFLNCFNRYHGGAENAGKVGLLREGIKANMLGLNGRDAQLIEQRKFQRQEIMLIFGIESMPGDEDSVSYNSLEQKNRAYLTHCLGPWMRQWEQQCERKLFTTQQVRMRSHYIRFDAYELVRPDAVSEADMVMKLRTSAIITANEGRDWLDLPPIQGGDELMNPAITPTKPGGDGDETAEDEPEPADKQQPTARERAAYLSICSHLVGYEVARVNEAAEKSKNFMEWTETFYASWKDRMLRTLIDIGGSRSDIDAHAAQSVDVLHEIAGNSTKDTFATNIAAATKTWNERAKALANTLLTRDFA